MTSLSILRRIRLTSLTLSALFVLLFSVSAAAQTPKKAALPAVETIKEYPGTGLMTGCGNLYFHQASRARSSDADYVFLSRGDGSHAWMNLNGRDVLLRQLKSPTRRGQKLRPFSYRYGKVRITVVIEPFKSDDAMGEGDPMYKMRISLRNGSKVLVVHAVGDADC